MARRQTSSLARIRAGLLLTLPAAAGLASGCAGYRLTSITPAQAKQAHDEGDKKGYIIYAPQPFLLGTLEAAESKSRTYEFTLIYLPDYTRPYRFTRYEFLAKSDLDISFADGWQFTNADSSTDSTVALTSLVDLAEGAVGVPSEQQQPPPVILFRIDTASEQMLQWVQLPDDFRP